MTYTNSETVASGFGDKSRTPDLRHRAKVFGDKQRNGVVRYICLRFSYSSWVAW